MLFDNLLVSNIGTFNGRNNLAVKFRQEIDKIILEITRLLSDYSTSKILQEHFFNKINSLFYGNLILNFFHNLNQKNIREFNLSVGTIVAAKTKYASLRKETKSAINIFSKEKIDEDRYNIFKFNLKKDFPELVKILSEVEKKINIVGSRTYLDKKKKELEKVGKPRTDLNSFFLTSMLEAYVQKQKRFPTLTIIQKLLKKSMKNVIKKFSVKVTKSLIDSSMTILKEQREIQQGFEQRLYLRWKKPLDLLESLIIICLECGEQKKNKLAKGTNATNDAKRAALIKIHARALQIAGEILTLLKAGYADGANARWRSLHELAVISFFLKENNNDVSRRYLEHEVIRKFRDAKDYQKYYKKLGDLPPSRKDLNVLARVRNNLIKKYGKEFTDGDYGWIPTSILNDRNFRTLEANVRIDRLRPYYNLSARAVHGGSGGFYRLGLMNVFQNKILLAGPSNYGLADPLQNAAISLLHVSANLLTLEPDFESLIQLQIMNNYIEKISPIAVQVQKALEKEERTRLKVSK